MHKAIDPIGNSRNDFDIFSLISEKLGIKEQFTENKNEEEWLKTLWDEAKESARKIIFIFLILINFGMEDSLKF